MLLLLLGAGGFILLQKRRTLHKAMAAQKAQLEETPATPNWISICRSNNSAHCKEAAQWAASSWWQVDGVNPISVSADIDVFVLLANIEELLQIGQHQVHQEGVEVLSFPSLISAST